VRKKTEIYDNILLTSVDVNGVQIVEFSAAGRR